MTRFFALTLALASLSPAFAQVPDYVPTDGLVGWWPFDGNALDAGPYTLNGLEYGVQATNSRAGTDSSAMYFNGSSHINLGNSFLLNPDTALSLSAWFRLDAPSSTNLSTIFGRNKVNVENRYCFNFGIQTIDGFQLRFGIEDDSNGSPIIDFNTPIELTYGEWFNYSATFSQATGWMTVYLNGLEAGRLYVGPIEINQLDTPTLIGFYRPNGNHAFQGALDDIGLWNRALNSFEIAGLFLSDLATQGCTNDLACNYDSQAFLDDGSCLFSGCMDEYACNYDAAAGCDDGSCDYSCCPGPGCCSEGMFWDWDSLACYVSKPADINMDGCVQLNDLLDLLSAYGDCAVAAWTCGDPLEYQGYDYETVLIGEQCWFAENVRYLPSVSPADLGSEDDGLPHAYVTGYSGTDIYEAASTENHLTYGALYNFAAVIQWQLCPSGWHVPSDGDWASSLDAPNWNGTELRSSTWNGTNQSGFNALPGGFRDAGGFFNESTGADFWTSTEFDASFAERRYILTTSEALEGTNDPRWKSHAFSVRCMKDAE